MAAGKVLISGAGVAGPCLAYWLLRHGFEPVLIEHAPRLRSGGYIVDFWGRGFDIAEKMGLVPALKRSSYRIEELRIEDARGRRTGGFNVSAFQELLRGRYLSILRSDLARLIYESLEGSVRTIFGDTVTSDAWECPDILRALESCTDLYFDPVSQIRLNGWSRGRVALVGDACFCPSLLAGQGSALAMIGAYIVAGELKRATGDHRAAFANYELRLRTFIESKQRAAQRFSRSFAPRTKFGIFVRNRVTDLMSVPLVQRLALGRLLTDPLVLPSYDSA